MFKYITGTIILFVSLSANSATVWDEGINGDLTVQSVGFLGAGAHEIYGSSIAGYEAFSGFLFDSDDISFDLAAGEVLESLTYSISNISISGDMSISKGYASLKSPAGTVDWDYDVYNGNTVVNDLPATDVGTYILSLGETNWSCYGDCRIDFDYAATVTISSVPVPAAVWLFGSAFLGLGAIKRKRS
jgi:hypothetical protein